MAKFIIVTGSSGTGKSTSIRKLWELLGGEPKEKEFNDTIKYRDKKIGFHSWGDVEDAYDWDGGIPELRRKRCFAIISAARTKGLTREYFIEEAGTGDLFWVGKVRDGEVNKSAKKTALHMKSILDAAIDGTL